ncbi:MAG: DUF4097 family beta strand repeat-containing protein [Gammaproteobacteria bacterium]
MHRLLLLALGLGLAWPAHSATRLLELTLDAAAPVEVVNLVGSARLVPTDGPLRLSARVTAADPDAAQSTSLAETPSADGGRRVEVRYPDLDTIRVDLEPFRRLRARVEYLGRDFRLDDGAGEPIRVDLEIRVPPGARVRLIQAAGNIEADGVAANLQLRSRFGDLRVTDSRGTVTASAGTGRIEVASFRGGVAARSGSGLVTIENVLGTVEADTGSGDVRIRGVEGDLKADTGSGSVHIIDAAGDRIVVDTGSGQVRLTDLAGSVSVDTGSGGVRAQGLVAGRRLHVDTGSGSVRLEGDFSALRDGLIDTGSGGVELLSTTPLSLRLDLDAGSGGIDVAVPGLADIQAERGEFRAVAGTGEGRARIETGSGAIRIRAPGAAPEY